jgi:hypothetical protein
MSAEVRERLRLAAGDPGPEPDFGAVLRHGTRLRRRRQTAAGAAALAAVSVVAVGVLPLIGDPEDGIQITPLEQPGTDAGSDPLAERLAVFDRARTQSDVVPEFIIAPWLDGGDPFTCELVVDRSRLASEHDGYAAYLIPMQQPAADTAQDPDCEDKLYVLLDLQSDQGGSAHGTHVGIPWRADAAWAARDDGRDGAWSETPADDEVAAIVLVVGDGFDTAITASRELPIVDNTLILTGAEANAEVTLNGPAGATTLTPP